MPKIVCVFAILLFFNCAPTVFISKEYKNHDFSGARVSVYIIDSTRIDYTGSMAEEFGPTDSLTKARNFICSTAVAALMTKSVFALAAYDATPFNSLTAIKLAKGTRRDSLLLYVPDKTFECNRNDSSDISLFLQSTYIFSKPSVQIISYGFIPLAVIPQKPLSITGNFIYWDNAQCKPIAWGSANGYHVQGPAITILEWRAVSYAFIMNTLRNTPFLVDK